MGKVWVWFYGKPVTKLQEIKDRNNKQIAKLQKENQLIDEEIQRQQKVVE